MRIRTWNERLSSSRPFMIRLPGANMISMVATLSKLVIMAKQMKSESALRTPSARVKITSL